MSFSCGRILYCYLILIFQFVSVSAEAVAKHQDFYLKPNFVRVRMFRDLNFFPNISGSHVKKISRYVWSMTGEGLKFQNQNLPYANVVIQKEQARFDLIALVEFNDYIAGVVSEEMPVSWPLEALRAQAVIARSFAVARIRERNNKYFHLDSNQADQVFSLTNNRRSQQAVFDTDGLYLTKDNGEILKAFYHADCGGQTVPANQVWGGKMFDSGTAQDPWCLLRNKNKWNFRTEISQFAAKLGVEKKWVTELGSISFKFKEQSLDFGGLQISVQKLRKLFGFSNLKSSIDQLEIQGNSVVLNGRGYGHGVGLCQWGTLSLVQSGKSYIEILKHYYPKAKLKRIRSTLAAAESVRSSRYGISN
jgi:stage II sporulation protein D